MFAVADQKRATILAVRRGQELVLTRHNDVGILFHVSTLLSENNVNVLGISAGVCGQDCRIFLITDDNRKAGDILALNSFLPDEETVVMVDLPHRAGMLKQVAKVMTQQGIDIRHAYAAADPEEDKCLLVLHTSNDEMALAKLQEFQAEGECPVDQERNANMVSEGGPI